MKTEHVLALTISQNMSQYYHVGLIITGPSQKIDACHILRQFVLNAI